MTKNNMYKKKLMMILLIGIFFVSLGFISAADFNDTTYSGLVYYYQFDEQDTTGSGTIIDELGNMNMTNAGADNTTGAVNTAYSFVEANTDWIRSTPKVNITDDQPRTFNFWLDNFDGDTNQGEWFFSYGAGGGGARKWSLYSYEGGGELRFSGSAADYSTNWTLTDLESGLQMITVMYDGTDLTIWVNTNQVLTQTVTLDTTNSDLYWGATQFPSPGGFMNGDIDEIMIYNKSISYDHMQMLYNGGSPEQYENATIPDNYPPTLTESSTSPATVQTNTDFSVNITATDPEESYIQYWSKLYINGVGNETSYYNVTNNTNQKVLDITSNYFKAADTLIAEIIIGDGIDNATAVNLTTVTVESPAFVTLDATNVTTNSSILKGNLTSIAGYDNITAYFQYREKSFDSLRIIAVSDFHYMNGSQERADNVSQVINLINSDMAENQTDMVWVLGDLVMDEPNSIDYFNNNYLANLTEPYYPTYGNHDILDWATWENIFGVGVNFTVDYGDYGFIGLTTAPEGVIGNICPPLDLMNESLISFRNKTMVIIMTHASWHGNTGFDPYGVVCNNITSLVDDHNAIYNNVVFAANGHYHYDTGFYNRSGFLHYLSGQAGWVGVKRGYAVIEINSTSVDYFYRTYDNETLSASSVPHGITTGSGDGNWTNTSNQFLTSAAEFEQSITGLSESTNYEFRAVIEYDGNVYYGSTLEFTTNSSVEENETEEPTPDPTFPPSITVNTPSTTETSTSVNINIGTDLDTTCDYSLDGAANITLSTSDDTTHTSTLVGLVDGQSYTLDFYCSEKLNSSNFNSASRTFTISIPDDEGSGGVVGGSSGGETTIPPVVLPNPVLDSFSVIVNDVWDYDVENILYVSTYDQFENEIELDLIEITFSKNIGMQDLPTREDVGKYEGKYIVSESVERGILNITILMNKGQKTLTEIVQVEIKDLTTVENVQQNVEFKWEKLKQSVRDNQVSYLIGSVIFFTVVIGGSVAFSRGKK